MVQGLGFKVMFWGVCGHAGECWSKVGIHCGLGIQASEEFSVEWASGCRTQA